MPGIPNSRHRILQHAASSICEPQLPSSYLRTFLITAICTIVGCHTPSLPCGTIIVAEHDTGYDGSYRRSRPRFALAHAGSPVATFPAITWKPDMDADTVNNMRAVQHNTGLRLPQCSSIFPAHSRDTDAGAAEQKRPRFCGIASSICFRYLLIVIRSFRLKLSFTTGEFFVLARIFRFLGRCAEPCRSSLRGQPIHGSGLKENPLKADSRL